MRLRMTGCKGPGTWWAFLGVDGQQIPPHSLRSLVGMTRFGAALACRRQPKSVSIVTNVSAQFFDGCLIDVVRHVGEEVFSGQGVDVLFEFFFCGYGRCRFFRSCGR